MRLLLDTQILIWAAGRPDRLSAEATALLEDPAHNVLFSVASLWEIAMKRALGRNDFRVDPRVLRRGLLDNAMCQVCNLLRPQGNLKVVGTD